MKGFIEKEKKKIQDFEKKVGIKPHDKQTGEEEKAKYYRNTKTGAVISAEEYQNLLWTEETSLTNGIGMYGSINMSPILEEEYLHTDENYVPED